MMVFCVVGLAFSQRTITGMVGDDQGEALIGANVLVKGTTIGTVTDIEGKYSLNVPADAGNTLVFSYTGYATREMEIGASNVMDLTMSEGAVLGEVVVTAVGLEANRAKLAYSIQNVDAEELLGSKEVNLVDALNSKVAGVQVTSSAGSPGASASIRIRGSVSVSKSNQPLFVVDGVPIDNSEFGNGTDGVDNSNRVVDINPNDIASMTVLKGPSATALYGVRAANGAIVITTKKGKAGKPKINISASYSVDQVNKFPELQSTYAQGRYLGGTPTYLGPETGNGFSWGPRISDLEYDGATDYFFNQNGRLVPTGEGNGRAAEAFDQQDFFVNGNTYDLSASVSGGTDAMTYFISGGRLNATGVVPNADFTRNTFRVNTSAKLTEKLSAGISMAYVNSGGNRIQRGSNLNGVMLGLLRTAPTFDNGNGKIGQAAADDPSTYVNPDGTQRSYRYGIYDSPYWTANKNPSSDDVNRVFGNFNINYDLTDGLFLNTRLGVDSYSDARISAFDINTGGASFGSNSGSVTNRDINVRNLNLDVILGYNKDLLDNLRLSGVVGYNVYDNKATDRITAGTSLSAPNFYHISNATDLTTSEAIEQIRVHGAYATADFAYDDFLFANFSFRNDWSSSLPTENNTYQSYSASLALELMEAFNIPRNDFLSYGKFRASYGVVGNDAPAYATTNIFTQGFSGGDGFITGVTFPAFGTNAFERSTQLANANLRPELSRTYELGGEFKFLKGKVGVDLTYYNTRSEDVIIAVQIPATTGFTSSVQNSAVILNKGWEITGDVEVLDRGGVTWNVTANFNQFTNDVESLAEGIDNISLAGFTSTSADLVPGQPYSSIYGNGWERSPDGDVVIGSDGWPLQDPTKKALGDPNPDWTLGLRNTVTFKGITLSALLDIRQGGDVWCGTCGIIDYFGTSQQSADERNDIVVFPGVINTGSAENPVYTENNVPVALGEADPTSSFASFYRVRYGFGGISEMNIFDASWVRLRDVSVGYSIPNDILSKINIADVRITLTGRNLWLNTDYPGVDPETNLTGVSNGYGLDYFNMPNTKSYNVTVNLTF